MAGEDLDRILASDYLGDLTARPLDELRRMRAECQEVEAGLSLARRVAQGRLDIVDSELQRRRGGGDPGDLSDLIAKLPEILADRTRGPGGGAGRLPKDEPGDPGVETEQVPGASRITALPELDDPAVEALGEELRSFERRVSDDRHEVHGRIDALDTELARRLRDGEVSVESLRR
jgi:anti-sigma-K factor RsiG